MKIGLDVSQTCTPRAGCAWYADSLTRAMIELAPDDQFFLYHQFGTLINQDTSGGTFVTAPNVTSTFTDVNAAEAGRIWRSPEELVIKTGAPDIVHAMSFRAPRVPGAKLVFTVYDVSFWAMPEFTTEENRLACQYGVLEALRNADGFVFISQSSHDEFERFLPGWLETNRKPWIVTPLAPRSAITALPPPAASERYWLAVGSIEPRKNYETLLDAFEIYWQVSRLRLPLRIAGGRGWKSDRLHQRMSSMAKAGMVEYLGYVPDQELPRLYAGAQALVFPSWYEGFGLPVVEALAQGCRVISSDRTSLKEAGGDAVLYFSPDCPEQIVSVMLRLEADAALRDDLRHRGLRHVARFTWDRTARDTLMFYQTVIEHDSVAFQGAPANPKHACAPFHDTSR